MGDKQNTFVCFDVFGDESICLLNVTGTACSLSRHLILSPAIFFS